MAGGKAKLLSRRARSPVLLLLLRACGEGEMFLVKLDGNALASCTPTSRDSGYTKYNQMLPLFSLKRAAYEPQETS